MIQTLLIRFLVKLFAEAASNEELQKLTKDSIKWVATELIPDIMSTFPALAAATVKLAFEKLPGIAELPETVHELTTGIVEKLAEADPDLPFGISDVLDVSEMIKRWTHR